MTLIEWLDRECPPGTETHDLSHDFAERLRERLDSELRIGINLWLDDIRNPAHHGAIAYTWAKTYNEAIELLRTGRVIRASLDHDLTIDQAIGQQDGKPTGYDVLVWMRDNNAWPAEGVQVHSVNPDGRRRMEEFVLRYQPIKQESK